MSDTVPPDKFYFNVGNMSGSEAPGKMDYISRDSAKEQDKGREQVPVHNGAGRPMTDDEREKFLERAEENDYVQRWQVSPPNGDDLSRGELRRETRRVADDYTRDKPDARVAYAVHTDQDGPNHSHVLITGNEQELRMDRDDIAQTRTNAHERMTANERYQTRTLDKARESTHEQATNAARGVTNSSRGDPNAERENQNFADQRAEQHDHEPGTPDHQQKRESMNLEDLRERERRERERRQKERENERENDNERGGIGR